MQKRKHIPPIAAHDKRVRITSDIPDAFEEVGATHLPKDRTDSKRQSYVSEDQAMVLAAQFPCKLAQLALINTRDMHAQINACIAVAENCLVADGIMPYRTPDRTDEGFARHVIASLLHMTRAERLAFIIHVLQVSPSFCRYMHSEFGVNPAHLDAFCNQIASECTANLWKYISGEIPTARLFVALAIQQWLQYGS
jgi:hypothetical protein